MKLGIESGRSKHLRKMTAQCWTDIYKHKTPTENTKHKKNVSLPKFSYRQKYLHTCINIYRYACIYGCVFYLHAYKIGKGYVGFRSDALFCEMGYTPETLD